MTMLPDLDNMRLTHGLHQVTDVAKLTNPSPLEQLFQKSGGRAYIVVPLLVQDKLLGILGLGLHHPLPFRPEGIEVVREIATQIAVAVAQARLREQIAQNRRELEQQVAERTTELRNERNFISAIFDTISALIVVLDTQGHIIRFNHACEKLTGFSLSEVYGKQASELFILPEEVDDVEKVIQRLRAGEAPVTHENYWRARNGDRHIISWSNTVLRNRAGAVEYVIGTGIDITERRRTLDALEQERNMLRILIDTVPDLIFVTDLAGRFVLNNHAHLRLLSATNPDEVIGKTDFDFFPLELAQQYYASEQRVMQTAEPLINLEETSLDLEGEQIWFLATKVPLRNRQGQITGMLGVSRDITLRREIQNELQESVYFNRRITETAPYIIYIFDLAQGRTVYVNPRVETILGYTADPMDQRIVADLPALIHPDDRALAEQHYQQLSEETGNNVHEIEYRLLHANGEWRWLRSQDVIFTRDAAGQPRQLLGTARDVTLYKQAEAEKNRLFTTVSKQREELRALTGRLAEIQESERRQLARELHDNVGRYLTALSLNLGAIQTQLDNSTLETSAMSERLNDSLELVAQTGAATRNVMADLRPPVLDEYGLAAALEWYGALVKTRTGLDIAVHTTGDIPRLAEPLENALFRIAQEALTNAMKHAQAGAIEVTLGCEDGGLRLVVADDGIGFDPNRQTEDKGHRGWGLLIMRERAEAVGACCAVEAAPRQGTRVIVEAKL